LYRQIVAGASDNRALAAEALLAMAECHQRLGDGEARKIYEEVVRKYPDQPEAASLARERLGRATAPSPTRGDRVVWAGTDVDLFGTVSPDGRHLTYIDWILGNVMLRDLVSRTSRALTNNVNGYEHGSPHFSAISEDGKRVAFGWYQSRGGVTRFELRIAPLDEPSISRTQTIWSAEGTDIRPFQWSHDNRQIAVLLEHADRTSQLGLLGLDGSLKTLTSLGWHGTDRVVFSPDSRYLAYDAASATGSRRHDQIHIIAADASTKALAFEHPSANTVMGWSRDGRHLLFASDRSGALALWALPVRNGRPDGAAFVVRTDLASSWSLGMTSAGTMYVWKNSGALYVAAAPLDLETGQIGPKPSFHRFIESRGRPHWSDDGKGLVFISCGPSGGGPCRIFIWSADTETVRDVPHSLRYVNQPRLSPDRRTILTNGTDLKGRRGAYLIDVASGDTRFVLPDRLTLGWSADGRAFHYILLRSGGRLIERDVASGAERDLITLPSECQIGNGVRLSPDRTVVGCTTRSESNRTRSLLVVPLAGGAPRVVLRVADGEELSNFWSWLPDGQGAIVARTDSRGIEALWHVPLAGTPRKLNVDLSKWTADGEFHLTSDELRLAFTANAGQPGAEIWALENILPRAKK
jgi:Tol biopolymer transport system component